MQCRPQSFRDEETRHDELLESLPHVELFVVHRRRIRRRRRKHLDELLGDAMHASSLGGLVLRRRRVCSAATMGARDEFEDGQNAWCVDIEEGERRDLDQVPRGCSPLGLARHVAQPPAGAVHSGVYVLR